MMRPLHAMKAEGAFCAPGRYERYHRSRFRFSCPVCQTVIYANSHHAFAEFCEEIFRQEDVDGAKIEFEKKDRLREEGAKNLVKLEAEFSGLRGKVRDGLREFHEIKLEEFDKMENGFREFHEIESEKFDTEMKYGKRGSLEIENLSSFLTSRQSVFRNIAVR